LAVVEETQNKEIRMGLKNWLRAQCTDFLLWLLQILNSSKDRCLTNKLYQIAELYEPHPEKQLVFAPVWTREPIPHKLYGSKNSALVPWGARLQLIQRGKFISMMQLSNNCLIEVHNEYLFSTEEFMKLSR
jgi:hypothetical protein